MAPGPELLRRVLLGFVTALLVARPLIPGEDPGRTQLGTGIAGLGLVGLWLVAAVGWAVWRAWSRAGAWRGSLVEVGLLALVGISFYSADQPGRYWFPGALISWEWVGVLAAFCLVRQLFRNENENDRLLVALLATGVALAVTGIIRGELDPHATEQLNGTVWQIFGTETISEPALQSSASPGLLALLTPPLFLVAVVGLSTQIKRSRIDSLALCIGIVILSPLLFKGLGIAAVAAAFPLMGIAVWLGDPASRNRTDYAIWIAIATAAIALLFGLIYEQQFRQALNARLDAWAITSAIIREYPLLGVGPGNFGRVFPAFLTSAAQQKIAEPPGFLLEIAANYGLLGLAVLVTTIALFFWRVGPALKTKTMASGARQPPEPSANDSDISQGADAPRSPQTVRWEFYLGGMAGLTLAFMLRFDPAGGWRTLAVEGVLALIRFVVWFGAFALLAGVPWTNRARVAATSMGVAALLVYLLFNPGIGFPSLAVPVWAMAALALNATPSPILQPRHWIGLILPAPLLSVLCLLFLAMVFYPAASAASDVAEARKYYALWRDQVEPRWRQKMEAKGSAEEKLVEARRDDRILKQFILAPLERAREQERSNAALCTEMAYWYAKEWQLYAPLKEFENNNVQKDIRLRQRKAGEQAVAAAAGGYRPGSGAYGAQELDPKGPASWWVLYRIRTILAKESDKAQTQSEQYHYAAENLRQMVNLDPTEPRLRLLWAEALLKSRIKDDDAEAKKQLEEALRLDAEAGDGPRRLSEDERVKIATLLGTRGN